MTYTKEKSSAASSSNTEANSKQVISILSRVQCLSSSYGLHPFSVIPISPDDHSAFEKTVHKWRNSKKISKKAFLLVLAIRPVFNQESLDTFVNDPGANNKIARSLLAAYLGNIKNSIYGTDIDGRRWAVKQADFALQIITASAKESKLHADVLRGEDTALFDTRLSFKEKGLRTYAVVSIV